MTMILKRPDDPGMGSQRSPNYCYCGGPGKRSIVSRSMRILQAPSR